MRRPRAVGYRLALPAPRHDRLADFRILVIDAHPLCPTAHSVAGAVNDLAERLARLGCTIMRSAPRQPDPADTTRLYLKLLAAFFSADLAPERRAGPAALAADDDNL